MGTFADAKNVATMTGLLRHYGIKFEERRQIYLPCPLPFHAGDRKKHSFNVNTEKDCWSCWTPGCRDKAREMKCEGNVLGFVMAMEECDIREAANTILFWFGEKEKPTEPLEPEHTLVDWLEQKTPPVTSAGEGDYNPSPPESTAQAAPVKLDSKLKPMQEIDIWFTALIKRGEEESDEEYSQRVKNEVKTKLMEWYKAGEKKSASA